jgi:hypothetical protein
MLGAAVVVAVVFYAVTQLGKTETPAAIQAELDDDPNLPGVYYPPHPGADGKANTGDERRHVATGVKIPICTQAQLDAGKLADPSYGTAGVCYTSNPPTSGPHGEQPAAFKVLANPAPKEALVHNMEHGAVVVWYNTEDQAVIDELAKIVNDQLDRRRLVVMSKYTEMEPNTIALTSWTRLDKFSVSDFTKKRVEDFIVEHQRRFNPEGF